jgi:hypothetical protein
MPPVVLGAQHEGHPPCKAYRRRRTLMPRTVHLNAGKPVTFDHYSSRHGDIDRLSKQWKVCPRHATPSRSC